MTTGNGSGRSREQHATPVVRDAPERQRFEATIDGVLAGYTEYLSAGGVLVFHHTIVEDAFGGRGVGSSLIRGTLEEMRHRGVRVVARCEYMRGWLARHPDYLDVVRPEG